MKSGRSRGFTLLELLVVIGLIAVMSASLLGGLGGGGQAAALQSAQATMVGLITGARTKASATGRKTRLLVAAEPAGTQRYLRHIVFQVGRQAGASPVDWDSVMDVELPDGTYIAPASLTQTVGLVATPSEWKRPSDALAELASDLFQNQTITVALPGDPAAQMWIGVAFTPNGTLASLSGGPPPKGYLVIAAGIRRPTGTYPAGEAPVQLVQPAAVRGLVLSAYGVPALLNDRNAF